MTGVSTPPSCSAICRSPAPIKVVGSTSHTITSTSRRVCSATSTIYWPSLFFALWIPGVSTNTIWPRSSVYTVWILFRVVWGLLDVIAIFCPISRFIRVDFPTLGRPIKVTKPDFFSCISFSILSSALYRQSVEQVLCGAKQVRLCPDLLLVADRADAPCGQHRLHDIGKSPDILLVRV